MPLAQANIFVANRFPKLSIEVGHPVLGCWLSGPSQCSLRSDEIGQSYGGVRSTPPTPIQSHCLAPDATGPLAGINFVFTVSSAILLPMSWPTIVEKR